MLACRCHYYSATLIMLTLFITYNRNSCFEGFPHSINLSRQEGWVIRNNQKSFDEGYKKLFVYPFFKTAVVVCERERANVWVALDFLIRLAHPWIAINRWQAMERGHQMLPQCSPSRWCIYFFHLSCYSLWYFFYSHTPQKNVKLLREMANLLIQARDIPAYVVPFCPLLIYLLFLLKQSEFLFLYPSQEVRRTLFKLEPGNKANWIALAVAMHLDKDYESVLSMLQAFENATAATPLDRYQKSEFLLFKVAE